jgi:hypothetical protein
MGAFAIGNSQAFQMLAGKFFRLDPHITDLGIPFVEADRNDQPNLFACLGNNTPIDVGLLRVLGQIQKHEHIAVSHFVKISQPRQKIGLMDAGDDCHGVIDRL